MKSKKRLALITSWFPPQKSVATNRMEAFAEYLSDDFEVEVFALNNRAFTEKWKQNVTVHYEKSNSLYEALKSKQTDGKLKHNLRTVCRIFLQKILQNPMKKWQVSTLKKIQKRHNEKPFDIVISSYAPIEPHLVAASFIERNSTVIWVADMRDEMSNNPGIPPRLKEKYREIEQLVNEKASVITSVSLPIVNDFKLLCPKVKHFLEIRNGFNHHFVNESDEKNEVFRLGYFGSFYGSRKPNVLFKALVELRKTLIDFNCKIEIYGAHNNFEIPAELKDKVYMFPHLNYNDAIHKMATMDCNVLIHPRSNQKGVFTGKLFDYISVQKSVLALVDKDDVAAELVNHFNAGYVAECLDLEENKKAVELAFQDWKTGSMKIASNDNVQTLHRSHQVSILKNYLLKIVE